MNPSTSPSRVVSLLSPACVAIVLSCAACDLPTRPPLKTVKKPEQSLPASSSTDAGTAKAAEKTVEGPANPFPGDWESWDAYFTGGKHVGYAHVVAEAVRDELVSDELGRDVRYHVEDQLAIHRGKATLIQRLSHTSTESENGRLLDFEGELRVGPLVTQFAGTVDEDALVIETRLGTSRTKQRLPWQATYRGLAAVQQSLHRKPMESGELRILQMLLPVRHQLATVRLHCSGKAAVPMIDGKHRQLLEVNSQIEVADEVVAFSVMWVDANGNTLRSYTPALRLVAYRTDEKTATESVLQAEKSLGPAAIEVSGAIERPGDAVRVAYLISPLAASSETDAVKIDPAPGQFIHIAPDGKIQVLVSRKGEQAIQGFERFDLEPTAADLNPSPLIDFKSPLIGHIAEAAIATRDLSDREVAMQLAQSVSSLVNTREFTGRFSKASDVASDAVGDSTDQAILLAALLRARGIPSRLATGFRYLSGDPSIMAYHIWTLGYFQDEWVPLDAMLGGLAPPDRITLVTTNLSDGNEYDSIIPVLATMGTIEISVSGVEY